MLLLLTVTFARTDQNIETIPSESHRETVVEELGALQASIASTSVPHLSSGCGFATAVPGLMYPELLENHIAYCTFSLSYISDQKMSMHSTGTGQNYSNRYPGIPPHKTRDSRPHLIRNRCRQPNGP